MTERTTNVQLLVDSIITAHVKRLCIVRGDCGVHGQRDETIMVDALLHALIHNSKNIK